jgi:Family of unknown function (DUF5947)
MTSESGFGPSSFAALRRFTRKRPAVESCELCSAPLPPGHDHLIEPAVGRLVCSCTACAILFSGQPDARYRRVPRDVDFLADFRLTDAQWEDLHLPINLAFFFRSTRAGRVVAVYPSPAGGTESLLTLEAWQQLEDENPVLRDLEPDVEALLVNRLGPAREHYRVPIDACYRLVGLIRANWRGLSGGAEVWQEIGQFFAGLNQHSTCGEINCHA